VDNQDAVDLHVVQGDRELARDNRSLARFALRGLPKLPAGVPRIRVSFTVDANGILGVYAKEEITGIDARIEVQPSYGLTDEEIERMLEAAIDHAESDVAARMDAEARVAAEGILLATEKAIADDAGLLLDGEAGDIAAAMAEVRALLGGTKAGALDAAARRLDEVTAPFAQRRIERDLGRALAGRDANSLGSELGVDASFHAHARGEAEVG
jgi:molecular chaperone HscA